MDDKKIPETLEEAYKLRDEAGSLEEKDFYQDHVYELRREEYRSRGIRTEISSRRRERQSAIEFSREMFFLEVSQITTDNTGEEPGDSSDESSHQELARRYAVRLDTYAFLKQLAAPHSGAVEIYRRNYLELLRLGKGPKDAYYLARVIGLAGDEEFGAALESVRQTGYPKARLPYAVERAAIQVRDLPGGMILILLTFFASLFVFVWATGALDLASPAKILFAGLGVVAAGLLMLVSAVFIITFIRSINK
jgi:hypothetical protein